MPVSRKEALDFVRREVAHEFSLLGTRVTWFVTCQSFLVAALVLSLTNPDIVRAGWLAHWLLPVLGFMLSVFVYPGILGARRTIDSWLRRQYELVSEPDSQTELKEVLIERFRSPPDNDFVHKLSLWFSSFLSPLLGLFWVLAWLLIRVLPVYVGP